MQHKINKILCPTDFSSTANAGITYAAHVASYFNASICLWKMFEVSLADEAAGFVGLPNGIGEQQKHINSLMESCVTEIETEFLVPCEFVSEKSIGNLEGTLEHYLEGNHYDLVIMGSNGSDSLYQFFFGSHSYQVSNKVACPIMVIPEFFEYRNMSSILFLTNYAKEDIKYLSSLQFLFSIPLEIVHLENENSKTNLQVLEEFKAQTLIELEANKVSLNFNLISHENLEEYIDKTKAGLIVMTSKKRNFFEKLLDASFSKNVLKFPDLPILVFPI